MRTLLITSLLFMTSAAWSQGATGSNGQTPPPDGTGSGVASMTGKGGVPVAEATFKAQCMASLAGFAAEKLKLQLTKDKAVSSQALNAAALTDSQLGASCNSVCNTFAAVSHKISWARLSPGFLGEPQHTEQKIFSAMPQPALPGKAELASCLPQQATLNWCPATGTGVGAGPSRIENPLDKIKVCITGGDALQHMNFTALDAARNCARPNIVDAAERIQAEHGCVLDAATADKKSAADKAAVDKAMTTGLAQTPKATLNPLPAVRQRP